MATLYVLGEKDNIEFCHLGFKCLVDQVQFEVTI